MASTTRTNDIEELEKTIRPFGICDHSDPESSKESYSLLLSLIEWKHNIWAEASGVSPDQYEITSGYKWAGIFTTFIAQFLDSSAERQTISLDPEGSMFCAVFSDFEVLKKVALGFFAFCQDETRMKEMILNESGDWSD